LPAALGTAGGCAAALQRLCDSGHHGLVATGIWRTIAVMTVTVWAAADPGCCVYQY
jgi:hypothetical protein